MKKKLVIAVIVLIVVIAAVIFLSQPKSIINDIDRYEIYRVVYIGGDVTERVDCNALASIISKYERSRVPHDFVPYQISQVVVEIFGINEHKPLHILLGDINVAYEVTKYGGFPIKNSDALLNEILSIMPYQTDEDRVLKEKGVMTFSDGESVSMWRTDYSRDNVYKLSDETTLLTIQDTAGPDNTYVVGKESYDDLSETAQKAVSAYYEKQGLLYDIQAELEKAYAEYLACKESGMEYHGRHISQDIVPTASNDKIMCFSTSVLLPLGGQTVQEIRLAAVFNRETGEALRIWDLFTLPEAEARQWLLDALDVEAALRAEMEAALKPEYISLSPENLFVTFPQGSLPSQEYSYGFGLEYKNLKDVLQPWAIPNKSR
ncbi:MAG: hypothetical protein GX847_05375 [Clostridiales bacterium]|nr:hypothetical protein [Clostridiales bacterium]